jgi:hypothetical protein
MKNYIWIMLIFVISLVSVRGFTNGRLDKENEALISELTKNLERLRNSADKKTAIPIIDQLNEVTIKNITDTVQKLIGGYYDEATKKITVGGLLTGSLRATLYYATETVANDAYSIFSTFENYLGDVRKFRPPSDWINFLNDPKKTLAKLKESLEKTWPSKQVNPDRMQALALLKRTIEELTTWINLVAAKIDQE